MTAHHPDSPAAPVLGALATVFLAFAAWLAIESVALLIAGSPTAELARWIIPTLLVALVGFGAVAVAYRATHTRHPARRAATALAFTALALPAIVGLGIITRHAVADPVGYLLAAGCAAAVGFFVVRAVRAAKHEALQAYSSESPRV